MVKAVRLLGAVGGAAPVAGCGGSTAGSAAPSPSASASKLTGPLTVLAAASLTEGVQ